MAFARMPASVEAGNENVVRSLGLLHKKALLSNHESIGVLWDAEYNVFSATGEDGILDFLAT